MAQNVAEALYLLKVGDSVLLGWNCYGTGNLNHGDNKHMFNTIYRSHVVENADYLMKIEKNGVLITRTR